MEKFLDLLKVFLEKHFIPAVVSVATALLVTAYTPETITLYVRLGQTLYIALLFCVVFAVVEFLIWIVKSIIKKVRFKIRKKQIWKDDLMNELENLWSVVDDYSIEDKRILMNFIKSKNAPIESKGYYMNNGLMCSPYIVSTEVPNNDEVILHDPEGVMIEKGTSLKILGRSLSIPKRLYKLDENFYRLLKYSYETYGRISHFVMEEENNG